MASDVSAGAVAMTWELKGMMVLQGKGMLAENYCVIEPGNYFAKLMIWGVGTETGLEASLHLMQQIVVAADAADNADAAAVAFPLLTALHMLGAES